MPVTLPALLYDLTRSNTEGGKRGRCSMPEIVMGVTFQIFKAHGKCGLTSLQSLALAHFIYTRNNRVVRGSKIEANNVTNFFYQERARGELKTRLRCALTPKELHTLWIVDSILPFQPQSPCNSNGYVLRLGIYGLLEQLSNFLIEMLLGRPGRNSSCSPSMPCSMNRLGHFPTVAC
jgi:hypothetical protein